MSLARRLFLALPVIVLLSAVISAIHYFQMFWSQINTRVQLRRRSMLMVDPKEKPQDVLTR